MKFRFLTLFLTVFIAVSHAQVRLDKGLVAYFSFDENPTRDLSGNNNSIIYSTGDTSPALGCGVRGNALIMDGQRMGGAIIGPAVFDNFKSYDFSMSFYFKPFQNSGSNIFYDLFSKKPNCSSDSSMSITYNPAYRTLGVELIEKGTKRHTINARLDLLDTLERFRCWYHIVVVRSYNQLKLFVNGKQAGSASTAVNRVVISNTRPLTFSAGPCIGTSQRRLQGLLDELRIYDRAINEEEVAALYYRPDKLVNRDTVMFLGSSLATDVVRTCATEFSWSPTVNIANPMAYKTTITPTQPGKFRYLLSLKDPAYCTSIEALNIQVIDPTTLDCSELLIPKAFTPNGDGLNDYFFISNPFTLDKFAAFEVFDAYGAIMFSANNPLERWDGTLNGVPVSPGVYLWKVTFVCKGNEIVKDGTVTLMK